MAVEDHIVFDDDNPEWTEADFVRARPADEVLPQAFMAAFRAGRAGSALDVPKQQVTLSLDSDVVARFRAGGPDWQTRINTILRNAK
jgi:uncharacterized protein (DUF4415 family)